MGRPASCSIHHVVVGFCRGVRLIRPDLESSYCFFLLPQILTLFWTLDWTLGLVWPGRLHL